MHFSIFKSQKRSLPPQDEKKQFTDPIKMRIPALFDKNEIKKRLSFTVEADVVLPGGPLNTTMARNDPLAKIGVLDKPQHSLQEAGSPFDGQTWHRKVMDDSLRHTSRSASRHPESTRARSSEPQSFCGQDSYSSPPCRPPRARSSEPVFSSAPVKINGAAVGFSASAPQLERSPSPHGQMPPSLMSTPPEHPPPRASARGSYRHRHKAPVPNQRARSAEPDASVASSPCPSRAASSCKPASSCNARSVVSFQRSTSSAGVRNIFALEKALQALEEVESEIKDLKLLTEDLRQFAEGTTVSKSIHKLAAGKKALLVDKLEMICFEGEDRLLFDKIKGKLLRSLNALSNDWSSGSLFE